MSVNTQRPSVFFCFLKYSILLICLIADDSKEKPLKIMIVNNKVLSQSVSIKQNQNQSNMKENIIKVLFIIYF